MKKVDIITLINCGILSMTAHDLKPAQAYKAFKLKKEVEKAFKDIQEEQKGIREDNGLTDELENKVKGIIEKLNMRSSVTEEEKQEVLAYNELQRKVSSLYREANKVEVALEIKPIPYEDWRKLQEENRHKVIGEKEYDILGGEAEIILEAIFWDAPTEDKKSN